MEVIAGPFIERVTTEPVGLSDYELDRNKPMPSLNHGIIQSRLIIELGKHYEDTYQVASEVKIAMPDGPPDAVPDLMMLPPITFNPLHDEVKVTQMPLGVIEIISASQTNQEILDKVARYFRVGVKSCWFVLPTFKLISVFSDADTQKTFIDGELHDEQLDIRLNMSKIFR